MYCVRIFTLLLLHSTLIFGLLIFEDNKLDFNAEILNMTIKFSGDRTHDPIVNIRIETFVTITKLILYANINIPQDENDDKYRKEFIKTAINIEKLMKGIAGNIIVKGFVDDFYKSIDFKPQLPFPPGVYEMKNLKKSDPFTALKLNTKYLEVLRFVGKVNGSKTSKYTFFAKCTTRLIMKN